MTIRRTLTSAQTPPRAGMHSLFSTPVKLRERLGGALNCYAAEPDGFDVLSRVTAQMLATQAAVVLTNAVAFERLRQAIVNLDIAVENRDLIGQAKGILMSSRKVTAEHAFELLRQRSQATNRNLRDIAEDVTRTGTLD